MTEGVKKDLNKLPYYTVLFKQFPNAIAEVIRCSKAGNNKYHETDKDWQNFSRVENAETRYKNAMLRHMMEEGEVEDMIQYGGMSHEGAVVWNALADLEVNLRNRDKQSLLSVEEVKAEEDFWKDNREVKQSYRDKAINTLYKK